MAPRAKHALLALAGLLALCAVHTQLPFGGAAGEEIFGRWAYNVVLIGAALLVLARGRAVERERGGWMLLGAAMLVWSVGNLYYTAALWDAETIPVPSLSDGFWIAFYPMSYVAVAILLRGRLGRVERELWLDGAVGALTVAAVTAAVVLPVVLDGTGGPSATVVTNLSYPLGDLVLLAMVIGGAGVAGWRFSASWWLMIMGLVGFAVFDSVYLYGTATGSWMPGTPLEGGWPLAMLLLAAAAWHLDTPHPAARRQSEAFVPLAFGLISIVLLGLSGPLGLSFLPQALAAGALLAGMTRMALTVRANTAMLVRVSESALTDSLTGLGNRRRLMEDLDCRIEGEQRLLVGIFDLNGFKGYNDTFGHPAGDALLERLAHRLRVAVARFGTAYRMGGDEFCVVGALDGTDAGRVLEVSAAALAESGEGFTVSASYGAAWVPEDGASVAAVLRAADQRLYLQKAEGRHSTTQQSTAVLMRALEERAPELVSHLDGVARRSVAVGEYLGLSRADLEALRHAARLHDVGKVAIPDAILSKPGPLDPYEWEFMRRHTLIGERILMAAPALEPVARVVRSTHESFDGSGYPDALAGTKIPLAARIILVCDAFDAMTGERAYRERFTTEEAAAELQRCAGSQFDPEVVRVFLTILAAERAAAVRA